MARKRRPRPPEKTDQFFMDSGAHSLYSEHVIKKNHEDGYAFYETKEFFEYVDRYCDYIKENNAAIDHYANVDVIFNPEKSYEVLKLSLIHISEPTRPY